jgi:solute carrier family 39 (zinc transporter), member 9
MASRGIEALAHSRPSASLEGTSIALPLLFGFTFMLVVEQLSSSHAHHHPRKHHSDHHTIAASPDSVFDVELAGAEDDGDVASHHQRASFSGTNIEGDSPPSPYPITIGLVVHSLADGLALGVSVLSSNDESSTSYGLSLVVFLALAVHKGKLIPKTLCPSVAHSVQLISTLVQLLPPLLTPYL